MYSLDEEGYYQYCLSHNIPYFGSIMRASQGLPIRHAYMQLLVKFECHRKAGEPFKILEIGSWAGGSAITWADAIKKYNQGRGLVICIDPWVPYFDVSKSLSDLPEDAQKIYEEMTEALSKGSIYELYEHNIRASNHEDIIKSFKGFSDDILPLLKNESFDLIFIDGNHSYSCIARDIKNATQLVTEGGLICGDDLELQLSEIDETHARKNSDMDYIIDPKIDRYFHPGVSLAIGDFLGEVSAWEGFWAMRKSGNHWEKVELLDVHPEEINIPKHLADSEERLQFQLQQTQAQLQQAQAELEQLRLPFPNPTLIADLGLYNIVAWRGNYYGMPKELGTIDLSSDDLSELKGIVIDQSLEKLTAKLKDTVPDVGSPILVEDFGAYNIIAWKGNCYGLPKDLGAVEFGSGDVSKLKGVLVERSLDKVKQLILSQLVSPLELERSHSQLQQTQSELERSQSRIQAMESSKFWQLRQAWIRVKHRFGLTEEKP